jgi:hypothetical protein
MLDLRTLDPVRQTADRRVALAFGYGALWAVVFIALAAGAGGRVLVTGIVLALAGVPWAFAFNGRWRLLDDALDGIPFVWRGERAGVWATAPIAGALLTLLLVSWLPNVLATFACLGGAAAYTALLAWVEARYERLILLDLSVLEQRFRRISHVSAEPRGRVRAADGDLEVEVRPGGETGRADTADR